MIFSSFFFFIIHSTNTSTMDKFQFICHKIAMHENKKKGNVKNVTKILAVT